ncbi:MAG TPA: HAD-IC family P-type ATPase, partial [Aquabacterium sp.]|nr:HAD-IC family P-type ATPase [Aquabacterium sp.]
GTLTEGRPRLLGLHPAGGGALGDDDLLAVAAAMQAGSEHPLARAVLQAVAQRTDAAVLAARAQARDTRSVGGRGLESVVSLSNGEGGDGGEGSPWRLASMPWMTSMALTPPVSDDLLAQVQAQAAKGATVTWLLQQVDAAQDAWQARAWLSFGDDLKPGAKDAVALLKAQGIYTVMISGDNWGAARAMAQAVGLDEVVAEVLPGQKADHVRALQRRGPVAMVGDGLNDAPALAAADVGMAMANPGGGTDVALHTAGITLMRGDPLLVPAALDIARQTSARIRQNLFWAFAYNVIGIPLAAMGGLNPMVAGAAMAMSSVSVLLNALRLTRWRPEAINSGTTVRSSTG